MTKKKTSKKGRTPASRKEQTSLKGIFAPEGGWKELFRGETLRFVIGMLVLIVALLMLLSFTSYLYNGQHDQANIASHTFSEHFANYGGRVGAMVAYAFFNNYFGLCSFLLPIFLLALSMKLMRTYNVQLRKWFVNCAVLMIWGSVALALVSSEKYLGLFPSSLMQVAFETSWGGGHGDYVSEYLVSQVGLAGTVILMIAAAIFYLVYLTRETIKVVQLLLNPTALRKSQKKDDPAGEPEDDFPTPDDDTPTVDIPDTADDANEGIAPEDNTDETTIDLGNETPAAPAEAVDETKMEIVEAQQDEKAKGKTVADPLAALGPYDPRKDLEHYKFPPLKLLTKYTDDGPNIDMREQNENKNRIVTVLRNFGVEITGIKATIGPTITLYEITPAPGVKISKIRNLGDDIALNLSALGVRIIAPIPGKGTIGIEVPNKMPRIVSMESILNSKKFQESKFELPVALGKTITNDVFMVDLAKMPHLLVAGATGQGKSVGLNAIITSLLYKKHPTELKLVMVDPKKVEFSLYAPIENHFLTKLPENEDPIITDVTRVVQTLKSLCQLMDHRYDLLKAARAKNIKEYNEKIKARRLNPNNGHAFMPYIVIIIDEFGDLIMTAGKEVELPIARIAQLARAVGMHMVIATQRPTTNIITGTIKANFPARMAFKVSSMIDSRTILDRPGANQLVGRGDMLFLAGNEPIRVQCAFVDTPEVERVNEFISEQQRFPNEKVFMLPEVAVEETGGSERGSGGDTEQLDSMFAEAARLIIAHQQGSTSLLQRKMGVGFARAGRIMDQMETMGIVGPSRGAKPREVLVQTEMQLEQILGSHNA